MKTKHQSALFFLAIFCTSIFAQGTWTKKTNFGGTARYGAAGFSIGTKAYIGTGVDNALFTKTFWQYDPSNDQWTQEADFPGPGRYQPVSFSIGTKGYVGTGGAGFTFPFSPVYKDFWEYDPGNNTWTQKADFGGVARGAASAFSIGNKGYIGTGFNDVTYFQNDFWEYDPSNDTWTQRADFGGAARCDAVGFSIGSKGYIGTGGDYGAASPLFKDFWEYDPSNDQWTKKSNFGGTARSLAAGFSIGSKGYIGTGGNFTSVSYKDFWEYDPSSDQWTKKANFGGTARWLAVGFSVGSKGYMGTGGSGFSPDFKDLWEYTQSTAINELDNPISISVYPNPSSGVFTIQTDEQSKADKIVLAVYDVKGERIYQSSSVGYPLSIDLSAQPRGVYFLNIRINERSINKKIIVQ